MIQHSTIELAIGVAVAPTRTRWPLLASQGPELGVEVGGPPRPAVLRMPSIDGDDGLVLEQVQLVDEEEVDAGLLEAHAVVLAGGGQQPFEPVLGAFDGLLDPLDGHGRLVAVGEPRLGERGVEPRRAVSSV